MKWQSIPQDSTECLVSKSRVYTALEGLALDLQVLSEDLRNSQNLCSGIVKHLQVLEQLEQEQPSLTMEVSE